MNTKKIKYQLVREFKLVNGKVKTLLGTERVIYSKDKNRAIIELKAKYPNRVFKIGRKYYGPTKVGGIK